MKPQIKKHRSGNEFVCTKHGKWIRNFTLEHKPYLDLNKTISSTDHFGFLENEMQNNLLRIPWIDSEKIYHPNIIIVSDGYNFKEKHKYLNDLPKDIVIIGVNGALAKWENKGKNIGYYVVNNPYQECMKYYPRKSKSFPKCIASARTFHQFLKLYKGTKYKYYPVNESGYSTLGLKEVSYQIDDYRNPICAAIGLAYRFGVENLLLFCCDDSFADERAGAVKLENGLYMYPQQEIAHNIIDLNLFWMKNQEYDEVNIADCSSGPVYDYATQISENNILDFFGITNNET